MDYQRLREQIESGMKVDARLFCDTMFPTVSRTFAVNVAKLSKSLRFPILISYMLCRIADTIEDDPKWSSSEKAERLDGFSSLIEDENWKDRVGDFTQSCRSVDMSRPDGFILIHTKYVLECFFEFSLEMRKHIVKWVQEMCLGMKEYALRKSQKNDSVTFLSSIEDLEKYCYYVAGTVGHLLTGLFHQCHSCIDKSLCQKLEEKATSFGVGLQMTNIIKDSIVDYQRGWCYLPQDVLKKYALDRNNFLEEECRGQAMQLMTEMIEKAARHLDDAMDYSCMLPKRAFQTRIFCFLPLFMAILSLDRAAGNQQLFDAENPVKITRKEVKDIVKYTYINCFSNRLMRRWYDRVRHRQLEKCKKICKEI